MAKLMIIIILLCTVFGINSQLSGSLLGVFGPPTGIPPWGPPLDLHGTIVKAEVNKLSPLTAELQVRVDEILENYDNSAADCQTGLGPSAPHWLYRVCVIGHMKVALNEIKIIENELAATTATVSSSTANAGLVL